MENYYSGQIKAMRWQTRTGLIASGGLFNDQWKDYILTYRFHYDKLGRLTRAKFGTSNKGWLNINPFNTVSPQNPSAVFTAAADYEVKDISYDLNGNIKTLKRYGTGGTLIDDLTYQYEQKSLPQGYQSVKNLNNLLYNVSDNVSGNANNIESIDHYTGYNSSTPSTTGRYRYNVLGQMIEDVAENNYIKYNSLGLVSEVYSDATKTKLKVKYIYSEYGKKIKTLNYDDQGVLKKETWYAGAPDGTGFSIYERFPSNNIEQVSIPLFGMGRLGEAKKLGGIWKYRYELADHLGNIRAVISGDLNSQSNDVDLLTINDYFPFGMPISDNRRSFTAEGYRYSYQGQEKEADLNWFDFDLRMYDSRIGRWNSPDPYGQHFSPYLAMSNNPVSFIDPNGGTDINLALNELNNSVQHNPFGVDAYAPVPVFGLLYNLDPYTYEKYRIYEAVQKGGFDYETLDAWLKPWESNADQTFIDEGYMNWKLFIGLYKVKQTGIPLRTLALLYGWRSMQKDPISINYFKNINKNIMNSAYRKGGNNGSLTQSTNITAGEISTVLSYTSSMFTLLGHAYYSTQSGTWLSPHKNILVDMSKKGNQYLGGRNTAKANSILPKGIGSGLGLLNYAAITIGYTNGEITHLQFGYEAVSNTISTFGGSYGAAWGIGTEMGRVIAGNNYYRKNIRPLIQDFLGVRRDEY